MPRLLTIKVAREQDLRAQIGHDGHYFDLVDFSRVRAFQVVHPLPVWNLTSDDDILVFLKVYNPGQTQLRYVGTLLVKASSRPLDILPKLRTLAGFDAYADIQLYEEIKFEHALICDKIDIHATFQYSMIGNGDIICYQKIPKLEDKYPFVDLFFQHVLDQKDAQTKIQALEEEIVMLKHQAHREEEAKKECDELKQERDNAVRQIDELRDQNRHIILEFSLEDLKKATEHFSDACKVADTEYGRVYKGIIHKTMVAIKLSCSQSLFQRKVSILRESRHPNIVTIIGVCSEACALVYEWLPNGNLEDCIVSKNQSSPPLSWHKRAQMIGDICCTLLFLHANKPSALVHGDLRPCNILIDANYRSKLCNLSMSNMFLTPGSFPPNLTARLPYLDPEFLTTGELTPLSDIYSLGVIIPRLLTGMPPLSIAKKVTAALDSDSLHLMIDKSAGDWPYTQAKQLALLGLSCVEMTREKRPDLLTMVWKVVEPMVTRPHVAYFHSSSEGSCAPAHFICPILMEIMKDPQVASDGFTYEGEAIRSWLGRGNNRSPMTNLALRNGDLVPNHALRSCIQEYLELQRQQASTDS